MLHVLKQNLETK